jgi:hypothetical protein
MMTITPFCVVGGHPHTQATGTVSEGAGLSEDWYMTRASFDKKSRVWYEDDNSPAKVCHCGEHPVDPPKVN